MQSRIINRSVIVNISLVLLTTISGLLLAEYVFRWMLFSDNTAFESLRNPSYYATVIKTSNEDFHTEDFWKLRFLFGKGNNLSNPHPVLGWTGNFDRTTLDHFEGFRVGGRRPVLLFGDSFAMCVDSVLCFEDYLNRDRQFSSGHFMLNFGAGGYGIDQIYLALREILPRYPDAFVILSFLTTDMDRCMLRMREAQKPYFLIEGDSLALHGIPITLSTKEYLRRNPPQIRSYLWNRFRYSPACPFRNDEWRTQEFITQSQRLNEAILSKAFSFLDERNTDYLVIIFQPDFHSGDDWRMLFLKDLCEKKNVPFICDVDIRNIDRNLTQPPDDCYAIQADGHPTSYMNRLVSEILKLYILGPETRDDLIRIVQQWQDHFVIRDEAYFRQQITRTSDWLAQVRIKAAEHGIPADSMLNLDASYMADLERQARKKQSTGFREMVHRINEVFLK
ncbi:MAG: hypothetical protein JW861_03290 [Bacteroidales bacterium]|nr:hypothetical protein [Bacteroidales bacterium]